MTPTPELLTETHDLQCRLFPTLWAQIQQRGVNEKLKQKALFIYRTFGVDALDKFLNSVDFS